MTVLHSVDFNKAETSPVTINGLMATTMPPAIQMPFNAISISGVSGNSTPMRSPGLIPDLTST